MGVTIHYEGRLRDEAAFEAVIARVQSACERHGWESSRFAVPSATLVRIVDEQEIDYVGPTKGIELMPHPAADPLAFEFDGSLFVQDFCKTQFAGPALHIAVVDLLEDIAPFFDALTVIDEGEYWGTHDEALLISNLEAFDETLARHLAENPDARGPMRLPSGRIIDVYTERPAAEE
ncbi:MAG: hypothetical protein EBR82_36450 [Caulobacteraceae bacterium]|nr:hypothetical protein [Caulobacteraceae bacterium]